MAPYHAERLAREALDCEPLRDPHGSRGLINHVFESRSAMSNWLAAHVAEV